MTLYRAEYRTRTGTRHMTFCHSSLPAAQLYALHWAIDDQLVSVQMVRPCERPVFNLTSGVTA